MRPQLLLFVAVCATLLLVFESSFILDPEVHQRAAAADAGGGKRAAALRVLFVVLFFNLYCTRDPRRPAPPSPNGKKSLGDRLVEFKPGCDVGDAAGFFRGKELSDANLKDA